MSSSAEEGEFLSSVSEGGSRKQKNELQFLRRRWAKELSNPKGAEQVARINEKYKRLEAELAAKYGISLLEEKDAQCVGSEGSRESSVAEGEAKNPIEDAQSSDSTFHFKQRKQSKALQRRANLQQKLDAQKEDFMNSRNQLLANNEEEEWKLIKEQLKQRGLMVHSVAADGHCMFRAIEHQLKVLHDMHNEEGLSENNTHTAEGEKECSTSFSPDCLSYSELRNVTADFLELNKEEFSPFFDSLNVEGESFEDYVDALRNTAAWGGELELHVLSKVLRRAIRVFGNFGKNTQIPYVYGEDINGPPISIVFHKHAFALGEHYNSVVPLKVEADEWEPSAKSDRRLIGKPSA